jgi:hypothetical protein
MGVLRGEVGKDISLGVLWKVEKAMKESLILY